MDYKSLFTFPLQLVITGRSRAGKSFLLRNRIIPNIIHEYDMVVVYSPTANLDAGWQKLEKKHKKMNLVTDINDRNIAEFIYQIGRKKEKGKKTRYLFIFDDITTFLSASNSSFFAALATRARHYNISYIITTHKYKALNPLIRLNAQLQIFFRITSTLELNSIADEIANVDNPPNIIKKMLRRCTGKYNAMLVVKDVDDDIFLCLNNDGGVNAIFSVHAIIGEFEETTGETFTKDDYKMLAEFENSNIMLVE